MTRSEDIMNDQMRRAARRQPTSPPASTTQLELTYPARPNRSNAGLDRPPPTGRGRHAPNDRLLDISEVATYLAVSERFIRRLVFERRIPYVKVGRLLRFEPEAIAAWLDSARRDPA